LIGEGSAQEHFSDPHHRLKAGAPRQSAACGR